MTFLMKKKNGWQAVRNVCEYVFKSLKNKRTMLSKELFKKYITWKNNWIMSRQVKKSV